MSSKKNLKLDLVKLTTSVKKQTHLNTCLAELDAKIKELGDISHLLNDPSFIHHLCNLVENLTKMTLTGKEKKALVIKTLVATFPVLNNDADQERLSKLIDFIVDSGIVQKVRNSVAQTKTVCSYIFKKLV